MCSVWPYLYDGAGNYSLVQWDAQVDPSKVREVERDGHYTGTKDAQAVERGDEVGEGDPRRGCFLADDAPDSR